MSTWDRLSPEQSHKAQSAAVARQVADAVVPFSPYWRKRFADLGVDPRSIDSVEALRDIPAVGERDVAPQGDPADMAALVLAPTEGDYVRHSTGPALRRALTRRLAGTDAYRAVVEGETRPTTYQFGGLGFRYPLASTRGDLDLVARAGARLWAVLGLSAADVLVAALPLQPSVEREALHYAALAAGSPAVFPGGDPADVAGAIRLITPTVIAAPAADAADLVDELVEAGVSLSAVRRLLLVGAPHGNERRAATAALANSDAVDDALVLVVHAPSGARVLWGECGPESGLHTYPDLEVVDRVAPETGDEVDEGPFEVVVTQLGFRGSALLRWRTGDVIGYDVQFRACPNCGRHVPRLPPAYRAGALVTDVGGSAVDLRAVAAAVSARDDVTDYRIDVVERSRDGRRQLIIELVPGGDAPEVSMGVAGDVRAVAGVLPDQVVVRAAAGELRPGTLSARISLPD